VFNGPRAKSRAKIIAARPRRIFYEEASLTAPKGTTARLSSENSEGSGYADLKNGK
jgi:hypothetical protein